MMVSWVVEVTNFGGGGGGGGGGVVTENLHALKFAKCFKTCTYKVW